MVLHRYSIGILVGVSALLLCEISFIGASRPTGNQRHGAVGGGWYSYWPGTVKLEGKLVKQWGYGPPGWGEYPKTDPKEEYFVLLLAHTINMKADTVDPEDIEERDVKEVQITGVADSRGLKLLNSHVGSNVRVTGHLYHQSAPGDRTRIVLIPAQKEFLKTIKLK